MDSKDLITLKTIFESSLSSMKLVEATLHSLNTQYPQLFLHTSSTHRIVEETVNQEFLRALELPWTDSPEGDKQCLGIELSTGYVSMTKGPNQVKVIYVPF